jgi:hypothetical protein
VCVQFGCLTDYFYRDKKVVSVFVRFFVRRFSGRNTYRSLTVGTGFVVIESSAP